MARKKILFSAVAGIFCLASFIPSAWSGTIITRQSYRVVSSSGETQPLETWKEYYQANKVAVYQGNAAFIIDIGRATLINILPSRGLYAVNTVQDFITRINRLVKQIKAQPMFKDTDKSCKSVKVTVKDTGVKKKILGYQTKKYEIYANGKKKREVWVGRIPSLVKEVDFKKTMKLKFEIENTLAPLSGCKDIDSSLKYRKLFVKGKIPFIIIDFLTGREEVERITTIEVALIPEKIFKVPPGFKKVPIEKFMEH